MDCNLDVNSYVFRNIEETVGDIGKIDIHTGIGMVNQKFGSKNLGIISKLNEAFKEKVISYLAPTDNDLPGTIQVTLSDRIYRYYLKKYGKMGSFYEPPVTEKSSLERLLEDNPDLENVIYDATIDLRLFEAEKLTNDPMGTPLDQAAGTGICDGTCGIMADRLQKNGMSYGSAYIEDKVANYHVVALTTIDGEKYILNQPQHEFISEKFQKAPLWERAIYWANYETERFNRHFSPELNKMAYGMGINPMPAFFETVNVYDKDFGPFFKDMKTIEREGYTVVTGVSIDDPRVRIAIKMDKGEKVEQQHFEEVSMSSTMKGEPIMMWEATEFKPRFIKATKENLIKEYKLTEEQAAKSMIAINNAQITPGKESNKQMTPAEADRAKQEYREFLYTQSKTLPSTSKENINAFKEYLKQKYFSSTKEEALETAQPGEQLDLFNQNISKIDIDTVTLSKSGMVTIGKNSYPFKNVTADFLESLGYSISDIGRILKKIC